MFIDREAAEILDLALELFYLSPYQTWSEALATARDAVASLRAFAADWDQNVATLAALAGDAETCYAASPF